MGSPLAYRQMRFYSYPEPKQGPDAEYENKRRKNPALRGRPLVIGATLIEWIRPFRKLIWHNSGFGSLRPIRGALESYEPRFDPTVTPIDDLAARYEEEMAQFPPVQTPEEVTSVSGYYSVADYHDMYQADRLTPTAVANAILPLIRRDTTPPGEHSDAWLDVNVELVLEAAAASTQRYRKGTTLSPIDGIFVAVKDEYDVEGYATHLGSSKDYTAVTTAANVDSITSWCAKKMQEAGAIILGKVSMHEYGLDTSGNNINFGTPKNPHNPNYYTGGSSSGCAYAVSAGIVPIALGSDGGGSIRIPAAFCSVFGLKPTHGRFSHSPGSNYSNTCAVNGPLAADIESLSTIYRIAGTPHPNSIFPAPPPYLTMGSNRDKTIGIPEAWLYQAAPLAQDRIRPILYKMVGLGYTLVQISIPYVFEGQAAHAMTVLTDAATLLPKTQGVTPGNKILISLGGATPAADYLLSQKLRRLLMQHLAHLWKQHPGMIIVTPTTGCAGWPIRSDKELKHGISDGDQTIKSMEYAWLANFTGVPSISVPAGFVHGEKRKKKPGDDGEKNDEPNVPVGIMGMAEWASEDDLLRWALDVQRVNPDGQRRPASWVDVIGRARKEMVGQEEDAAEESLEIISGETEDA